jgi:hypothetical protein
MGSFYLHDDREGAKRRFSPPGYELPVCGSFRDANET